MLPSSFLLLRMTSILILSLMWFLNRIYILKMKNKKKHTACRLVISCSKLCLFPVNYYHMRCLLLSNVNVQWWGPSVHIFPYRITLKLKTVTVILPYLLLPFLGIAANGKYQPNVGYFILTLTYVISVYSSLALFLLSLLSNPLVLQ